MDGGVDGGYGVSGVIFCFFFFFDPTQKEREREI